MTEVAYSPFSPEHFNPTTTVAQEHLQTRGKTLNTRTMMKWGIKTTLMGGVALGAAFLLGPAVVPFIPWLPFATAVIGGSEVGIGTSVAAIGGAVELAQRFKKK